MRTLVLHIGNHCTGSDSIQVWLSRNSRRLAEKGIAYFCTENSNNSDRFIGWIDSDAIFPHGFALKDPKKFEAELRAIREDMVVVSSDNFAYFFLDSSVNDLAQIAYRYFEKVLVVCYLRRQDLHATLHHARGAVPYNAIDRQLWGDSHGALPEPNQFQPLYLDYQSRLELWERHFERSTMKIRVCEGDLAERHGVLRDFIELIGAVGIDFSFPEIKSRSICRIQARAGRILNWWLPNSTVADLIFRSVPDSGVLPMPSRGAARRFLSLYRDGNRLLNQRFAISSSIYTFSDDMYNLPVSPQAGWTDEEFNSALSALIRSVSYFSCTDRELIMDDMQEAAKLLQDSDPDLANRLRSSSVTRPWEVPS